MKKVTDKQIEEMQNKVDIWLEDDYSRQDITQLLAELATGAYSIEEFRYEIENFGDGGG